MCSSDGINAYGLVMLIMIIAEGIKDTLCLLVFTASNLREAAENL